MQKLSLLFSFETILTNIATNLSNYPTMLVSLESLPLHVIRQILQYFINVVTFLSFLQQSDYRHKTRANHFKTPVDGARVPGARLGGISLNAREGGGSRSFNMDEADTACIIDEKSGELAAFNQHFRRAKRRACVCLEIRDPRVFTIEED